MFFSQVQFDSSARKHLKDSLIELGNRKTSNEAAAGGTAVRYFTDSVEWRQRLNISSNDSTRIKGKVTWLAGNGGGFPAGEEPFSIKVKTVESPQPSSSANADATLWSTFFVCLITGLFAVVTPRLPLYL